MAIDPVCGMTVKPESPIALNARNRVPFLQCGLSNMVPLGRTMLAATDRQRSNS